MEHALKQREVFKEDPLVCYGPIRLNIRDLSAFLEPFQAEVWVLLGCTLSILSWLLARIERQKWSAILWESIRHFITVPDFPVRLRRMSGVIVSNVLLLLTLFFGTLYRNDVMTTFVDPKDPITARFVVQCRFSPECDSDSTINEVLYNNGALCSLSGADIMKIDQTLHRSTYSSSLLLNRSTLPDTFRHANIFILGSRAEVVYERRSVTSKFKNSIHTLPASLTERSRSLRLGDEHGLFSIVLWDRVKYKARSSKSFRNAARNTRDKVIEQLYEYQGALRPRKTLPDVYFKEGLHSELFDWKSFQRMMPLIAVSISCAVTALLLEMIPEVQWRYCVVRLQCGLKRLLVSLKRTIIAGTLRLLKRR